ncbi:MopE-related protein [Salinimicrobium sp. HB62]|uniref:MopE-related protein n=1 Tax=Salinimicrobium sp. HB62 TaxID=3077781 RepID=UPI002D7806AB|nr:CSLREA domain-containing protein [Salinimicrobium sp. HB62]
MKNFYNSYGKLVRLIGTTLSFVSKKSFLTLCLMLVFYFDLSAQSTLIVNSVEDNPDINLNDGICGDSKGRCTLRAAIETANQTPETDEIQFSFPGKSPHVISLTGDLPVITETVILNATTENDYSWSSPVVVIDGGEVARFGFKLEGQSSGSTIQGFVMGNFNIMDEEDILGNGTAIYANGTGSHHIKGNFLGVTPDGRSAFSNTFGVALVNSSGNIIGGTQPGDRNLISGNHVMTGWGIGIYIHGENSYDNRIQGNFIGTDATGTQAIPNYWGIVTHEGANNTLIGGATAQTRNIISGNIRTGVYVLSPDNIISGNYIGLGQNGEMLAYFGESRQQGIRLWTEAASNNTIGGLEPGEGNVISGNIYFNAITIGAPPETPLTGNKVFGNFIGTDPSGQYEVPNYRGITMTAKSVTVANNLISGNYTFGVSIHASKDIQVYNNLIGTKADGVSPLGNGEFGIQIFNGSENNIIGSSLDGKGNTIAHNGAGGILVSYFDNRGSQVTTQPLKNTLTKNNIFGNLNIGIDLDSNGVSENDPGDDDFGANFLQNFPDITEASVVDQVLDLDYVVPSDPANSVYPITVEFFKSDGNRQGKDYLTSDDFREQDYQDGVPKNLQFPLASGIELASGDYIIGTATDANGNTSEFSAEVQVIGDCTPQTWYLDADNDSYGVDFSDTNISSCTQPDGNYITRAGDCDDIDPAINPEAEDIPDDGIDQDCDGVDATTEIVDFDGDGVADSEDNCPGVANADQVDSNGNGVGDACETTQCLGTDTLNISECTSGSTVYWTVNNAGACAVDVRWEVRKGESGSFTLDAGATTQFDTAVASKGQTQVVLYWNDSTGAETKTSANASGTECMASASLNGTAGDTEGETPGEAPYAYPNPIESNGFYVSFPEHLGGLQFSAGLYDVNNRLMSTKMFEVPVGGGDIYWSINTERWKPGVYFIRLDGSSESYQINLLKE